MHFITILTKKIEKESWQPYYRKKRSPTFGTAAGEHNVSKKLSAKWEKVFLIGSHFIYFFYENDHFFFSAPLLSITHPI